MGIYAKLIKLDNSRQTNLNLGIYAKLFKTMLSFKFHLNSNKKFGSLKNIHKVYLLRIQVIDRKQIVLTPIEVAIEDIQLKVAKLAAAIKEHS